MRGFVRFLFFLLLLLVILLAASVAPIDRYEVREQPFYQQMVNSITPVPVNNNTTALQAGASKVSITPIQRTATAGYGKRRGKLFGHIDDSVYVRTIVLSGGSGPVAIVAADLLIIPPLVRTSLAARLPQIGFSIDQVYLGATHSHNSIGHWSKGVSALLYGTYSDSIVNFISEQIIASIRLAAADMQPADLSYLAVKEPNAVRNRLNKGGAVDSTMHVISINRADKKKFLLTTFAAHATCYSSNNITLSRDYPGQLVDRLEAAGFDHAQFMAGAVGSQSTHRPDTVTSCVDWTAGTLVNAFLRDSAARVGLIVNNVSMQQVPLRMPEVQAKISENWRLRPWVFRALMGESDNFLTVLKAGPLLMVGTPCDFSGELALPLYQHARQNNLHLVVTSFNGGYMGYIIPDKYYDKDHYETRLMNWYGPGNGTYFSDCIRRVVDVNAR